MAPTLAQLLAAPGLGLRVVAGAGAGPAALRRPVTWVAVSELADPTPYLQGRELLLLTGLGADLDAGARAYVDRLVVAGVSAVGFGVGVVHDEVPPGLAAAADAAGLPLVEVDRPTPFVAVGKALAGLIAVERGERDRRRLDGMRALTAHLARGAGPGPVLARLAELVSTPPGWAALLDARARCVAAAGVDPRADVAQFLAAGLRGRPGYASAADADESGRVTVLQLGVRERAYGYLAVGVGPGVDLDHQLVTFAASLLTLDREHARGSRPVRRWARAAALALRLGMPLPPPPDVLAFPASSAASPGSPASFAASSSGSPRAPGVPPAEAVRALVCRRPLSTVLDALPDEVSGLVLPDGWSLVLVAESDVEDAVAAAGTGPGGLSGSVPADGDLMPAVDEARSLAARARAGVLRAGEAPPSIVDLLGPSAAAAFAAGVLAPLQTAPDAVVLRESLQAYLSARGALAVAAERLGVHRHTLRARLRRARELLDRDLDDPAVSADLWIALSLPPARAPGHVGPATRCRDAEPARRGVEQI